MVHFSVSGISGMELFSWDDSTSAWRHVQPLQLAYAQRNYDGTFVSGILPATNNGLRRYLLHLPTYNNPVALQIGVDAGAAILPDPASSISPSGASVAGPIVWYGECPEQQNTNECRNKRVETVVVFPPARHCAPPHATGCRHVHPSGRCELQKQPRLHKHRVT